MRCKTDSIDNIMKYFEGGLSSDESRALEEHLASCKRCRSEFLALELASLLGEGDEICAPAGFEAGVMEKLSKKAHAPEIATSVKVLWGLSAALLGFIVLLVINPDLGGGNVGLAMGHLLDALANIGGFLAGLGTSLQVETHWLGVSALVFAGLLCTLMYALSLGDTKQAA